MSKKSLILLIFVMAGVLTASAQNLTPTVVATSGGSGSSNGTSLSWTTGELAVQNHSSDTLMLTQGFEQGEISVTTAVDGFDGLETAVQVYPNPVQNELKVDFQGSTDQTARIRLLNLNGKRILSREISRPASIKRLNLNGLAPGTYMLEVRIQNRRKVFKIVKH